MEIKFLPRTVLRSKLKCKESYFRGVWDKKNNEIFWS